MRRDGAGIVGVAECGDVLVRFDKREGGGGIEAEDEVSLGRDGDYDGGC